MLGKRLGLFHIDPEVGQGLCLWLPKGASIRGTLEEFLKKELIRRGYEPVYSPHIGRVELYETSGALPVLSRLRSFLRCSGIREGSSSTR